MKRIVEPFCVIYLLLPIGSFSSCARKPPGASLPLSTFTFWQAGIVLLLLLMTSLSIILHYRYRRMKTRIQKEKEMAYLEACRIVELEKQKAMQLANKLIEEKKEMAVQQSRAIIEQAKEEARQLQAQVTTTSVMLANKTDYLLQLQEKLKAADNTDCRRIAKEIRTNLTEADHWSDFIKNFNLLHSHYVDRIVKTHPGLTANEVRLICFILSGLSNKEIASIFSVEPESVKKARYRLKKKLHLKEEESLSFYLHNLRTTTDSVEVQ
jgi:DNA-binding CsgD family transcriptional regulator